MIEIQDQIIRATRSPLADGWAYFPYDDSVGSKIWDQLIAPLNGFLNQAFVQPIDLGLDEHLKEF